MKKIFVFFTLIFVCKTSFSQRNNDSGTFFIHKFEQNIGKEKYIVTKTNQQTNYAITFNYIDRGSPVDLKANISVSSTLEPVSFNVKGGTSRMSSINDSIAIQNNTAFIKVNDSSFSQKLSGISYPVAGYSPAVAQILLIQYWNKNNKPSIIHMLPTGNVVISKDGKDTFMLDGKSVVLDRYIIKGLIWGNELLWMDATSQLVCLITNDAEGDKQEIVSEPYEKLLPSFVDKAAVDGMRLFVKNAKPSFQKHSVIAITNGTLVDVEKNTSTQNTTIIIENGKIKSVGKNIKIPVNAFIIDAKNKTVLPGLWDMHAHFEQAEWGPAYLAAGVTTVRDCGNEFGYINTIQKTIDDGAGIGPHILKAGIIDGKGPRALGIIQADTKEEAVVAVDRYKQNGFVQIKIYSSVKPEIVKAICDEAHKQGLTVTGHIPSKMNIIQGVDSGMDMVNHLQYVFSAMKLNKDHSVDLNDSTNKALLSFLKKHNVVIDPTLGVFEMIFRPLQDSITTIEPNFKTLPLPLQTIFLNTGVSSDSDIAEGKIIMKDFKDVLNALYRDSITIVAGTDMDFPGYSVARELELYVESGLTPMAAIKTATITPAMVMKLDSISGSVQTGKNADIIIVDGDPLQNIRNIRNVTTVIKEGNVYSPSVLHEIAGFNK